MVAAAVFSLGRSSGGKSHCPLADWPSAAEVAAWPLRGQRERCFCAYAQQPNARVLESECPSWRDWVSTDRVTPDRVTQTSVRATVLAAAAGNATSSRYAFVGDWAVDLGSGYGADCDPTRSPGCVATGAHVLSVPRKRFMRDCCGVGPSLASLLREAPRELCDVLLSLIEGVRTTCLAPSLPLPLARRTRSHPLRQIPPPAQDPTPCARSHLQRQITPPVAQPCSYLRGLTPSLRRIPY